MRPYKSQVHKQLYYDRVLPYPEDPNKESNGEESTEEAYDDVSHLKDPRPFKLNLGGSLQNKENIEFDKVGNKHNGP